MSDPVVRTMIAYPAEWDCRSDASALSRALAIHDAVPDEYRPSDSEPLRNCLPGIWPCVGDLRATVALTRNLIPDKDEAGFRSALRRLAIESMTALNLLSEVPKDAGGPVIAAITLAIGRAVGDLHQAAFDDLRSASGEGLTADSATP